MPGFILPDAANTKASAMCGGCFLARNPVWRNRFFAGYCVSANTTEVQRDFGSASILRDGRVVFNIAGNKYRIVVWTEGDGYVSWCPGLDVARKGASIGDARANLKEALELFFESADPAEINTRLHGDLFETD